MALPPANPRNLPPRSKSTSPKLAAFQTKEMAAALLQGSKPQTIGVALNDSPAGLCAWLAEKLYAWSDCNGRIESVIDRDTLLTNLMLYWATGTAASAARFYYEFFHNLQTCVTSANAI